MKPIKRGMTEAVTRDGRKVTQLTWFDVGHGYWFETTAFYKTEEECREVLGQGWSIHSRIEESKREVQS